MRERKKIGKSPKLRIKGLNLDKKDPWYEEVLWWIEDKWKSIVIFFTGLLPNYISNLIYYHKLMWTIHHWDMNFILKFEKKFMKRALKRYENHESMLTNESEDRNVRNLRLMIKLIDMMENCAELDEDAEVNMNNKYRFIPEDACKTAWKGKDIDNEWSAKVLVREMKIWNLYCLIRNYKFHEIWD